MNLTREEANLLRILNESGGALLVTHNARDAAWDRLVSNSYVSATTTGEDSVRYELTDAGREALRDA